MSEERLKLACPRFALGTPVGVSVTRACRHGRQKHRAAFLAVSNPFVGLALLIFAGLGALVDNLSEFGGLYCYSAMALLGAAATLRIDEAQSRSPNTESDPG